MMLAEAQSASWLYVKDAVQMASLVSVIVCGAIAARKGISELREGRAQRASELRWRQANATREMLREIHTHPLAGQAIRMLDWADGCHNYRLENGTQISLTWAQVLAALQRERPACEEPAERFVWDSFDWLFYYVDRIDHYVDAKLLDPTDIRPVFQPYVQLIQQHRREFGRIMDLQGYQRAKDFFGV